MVTHIYHDKDSGKSGIVTILVVSGVGLTSYYAICWWKGWDFFGLSQQRTQQMFQSLNDSTISPDACCRCSAHADTCRQVPVAALPILVFRSPPAIQSKRFRVLAAAVTCIPSIC